MAIADFKGKMNELKRNISMLKIYAQYFADDDYRNDLDQYIKDINEDRFQMLVVGEFSRGKSTLINALLGKAIIPSSRNPTTATLNVIKNGVKDEYNLMKLFQCLLKDCLVTQIQKKTYMKGYLVQYHVNLLLMRLLVQPARAVITLKPM